MKTNTLKEGTSFYSFGPSISLDFLNYGRIQNSIRVQDAKFEQALSFYKQTLLGALKEVEDAIEGYADTMKQIGFLEKSLENAKRSVVLSMLRYKKGAIGFQSVLDSMRVQAETQDRLAQTRGMTSVYMVQLYQALGGGKEANDAFPLVSRERLSKMNKVIDWSEADYEND